MPINGRLLKKYYPWQDSSYDQVSITPLIKTFRSKMLERAPMKSFFLSSTDHITDDQCRADRNAGYIMMHDVNIKEETKCETLVLALLLFTSSPMNLTGFSYDQVNITPLSRTFRSKMFRRAPKKSFFLYSMDQITVDQCQADRTLLISWRRNKVWNFGFSLVTFL